MLTEREWLFLRTLQDLERRIECGDPYEILMMSGLIRKLLLDGSPLVDQINRGYNREITFEVGDPPEMLPDIPKPDFSSQQDGIDPDAMPPVFPRARLNREQFFKKVVVTLDGHQYTVKDVVLFEGHVKGGVHPGRTKNEREEALDASTIVLGGYRPSQRQLHGIGRVVLKALSELREDVSKKASQQ